MEILAAVTELLKVLLGVGLVYLYRFIKLRTGKNKRETEDGLLKHEAFDKILSSFEERLGAAYDKIEQLSDHILFIQGELLKAKSLTQEKTVLADRLANEVKRLNDEVIRLEHLVRSLNDKVSGLKEESG